MGYKTNKLYYFNAHFLLLLKYWASTGKCFALVTVINKLFCKKYGINNR